MNVAYVWSTPNAENLIMYMARVSNPENQDSGNTKLIRYLVDHKHWSPFEMANLCVGIKTSRAIGEQILRHRSFSFQIFSQRYAEVTELEPIELRRQSVKNRQSSADVFDPLIPIDDRESELASNLINLAIQRADVTYKALIQAGVAKECARMILPMASQTRIYMNGTLRSWIHYLGIRDEENVQKEHRDIARAIKGIFIEEFPIISEALGWCMTTSS